MLVGFAGFLFYVVAIIMLVSASLVIIQRNMVHCVLFLIFTFFNASILFLLAGAEFLAMILLIVYVGAVSVLFLFVVMMLDIDVSKLKAYGWRSAPVALIIGILALAELIFVFYNSTYPSANKAGSAYHIDHTVSNTVALGNVLYTDYVYYFELASIILLVAMIGSIVLTLHKRASVKRQNIFEQVSRDPNSSIELKKVQSRSGLQG